MRSKVARASGSVTDPVQRLADAYRVAPRPEAVARAISNRTLHKSVFSCFTQRRGEFPALAALVQFIADNPGTTLDRLERDDPLSDDVVAQMDSVVAKALAASTTRTMSDRNLVELVLSDLRDAFWREKTGHR